MLPEIQELRTRATQWRQMAAQARRLAQALGSHLDDPYQRASAEGTWSGTFARDATTRLHEARSSLHAAADALGQDATRWLRQAEDAESDAAQLQAQMTGHG